MLRVLVLGLLISSVLTADEKKGNETTTTAAPATTTTAAPTKATSKLGNTAKEFEKGAQDVAAGFLELGASFIRSIGDLFDC